VKPNSFKFEARQDDLVHDFVRNPKAKTFSWAVVESVCNPLAGGLSYPDKVGSLWKREFFPNFLLLGLLLHLPGFRH